jgi:GNAT superfamily N-acetyltransferase
MPTWTVHHVTSAPASLDAPDAWPLHGAERVTRARETALWGYPDLCYPAWYLLAEMAETPYSLRRFLVAVPADVTEPTAEDVVGFAKVVLPLQDNVHFADVEMSVHPDHETDGVDEALLDAIEGLAAEHGRTTLLTWSDQVGEPDPGPGVVEPPTGSGRIRVDAHLPQVLLRRGYTLEQAERYSVLHLPVDEALLARHLADAAEKACPDYRLVSWTDRTPDEWVDQVAVLETRMSTDAPQAGIDWGEARWDAERVRTWERQVADSGHGYLLTAAVHEPTQTLAAFTVLRYPLEHPEIVFQEDTLVLAEHRGRRLGMLVKAENLRRLREVRPDAARIHTWNAQENSYMLDINVALGFRLTGVPGAWQKRLDATDAGQAADAGQVAESGVAAEARASVGA